MTGLPAGAPRRRSGIDDKRWAQRANTLQFQELEIVRSAAQLWRNGLTGLTALLSVTSIVVAPNLADHLQAPWRYIAGILALGALLALLYGAWQAMRAAFGVPGDVVRVTGERLRVWESGQARTGVTALRRARAASLIGMAALITTVAIVFISAQSKAGPFVLLETGSGTYCGHLGKGGPGQLRVIAEDGTVHTAPLNDVHAVTPLTAC